MDLTLYMYDIPEEYIPGGMAILPKVPAVMSLGDVHVKPLSKLWNQSIG